MRETLPIALRLMFGAEGGYSDSKSDSGNYLNGKLVGTKYGITGKTLAASLGKPSVTAERVKAISIAEAETIYRKSYWAQSGGDVLPKGLDYTVFDTGVNSGPNRAVKILQKVVGVKQDGWIGEATLAAVKAYEGGVSQLIRDYCKARMAFLMAIKGPKGWRANGRGWTIRVTGLDPKGQWAPLPGVLGNAVKLASGEFDAMRDAPNDYDGAPEGGDAKAEPKPSNPWTDPGTILSGAGGILGSLGALFAGSGPVQWALAAAIIVAVGIGSYLLIRKLGKAQA